MGSEWIETTIGDFCPFTYGKGLPESKRDLSGNIAVYGSNGIVGKHDVPFVDSAGIIIGRKGTVGAVHYSGKPFWPIDTTYFVSDEPGKRDLLFTYYLLKGLGLEQMNSDSAVPGLNRDAAHMKNICVPPLPEQHAIAHILGSLDDKIELNKKMNETLEAMARAIFKSWFVDFLPVRAKAEGRDPCLPKEIADLFPDSFENSELGKIPVGWKIVEIGSVSNILNGFAFKSKDYCDSEGIRVLRTKNFDDSGYATKREDDVFLPKNFMKTHSQYICEPFDFHIVMVGASVGKSSLLLPNMLPALRNQNMWCFRPKKNIVSKFFLNFSVQRKVVEVMSWADGSARSFFRKSDFHKHLILLPHEDILKRFEKIAHDHFNLVAKNLIENESLSTIRDTLLPKLISGELQVPDAEKFVEGIV